MVKECCAQRTGRQEGKKKDQEIRSFKKFYLSIIERVVGESTVRCLIRRLPGHMRRDPLWTLGDCHEIMGEGSKPVSIDTSRRILRLCKYDGGERFRFLQDS